MTRQDVAEPAKSLLKHPKSLTQEQGLYGEKREGLATRQLVLVSLSISPKLYEIPLRRQGKGARKGKPWRYVKLAL